MHTSYYFTFPYIAIKFCYDDNHGYESSNIHIAACNNVVKTKLIIVAIINCLTLKTDNY